MDRTDAGEARTREHTSIQVCPNKDQSSVDAAIRREPQLSDSHERKTMSNALDPESNEPGHNLRSADNEALFAEVRSRQIDPGVLREQLQVSQTRIHAADPSVRLRLSALMILGALSLVLIGARVQTVVATPLLGFYGFVERWARVL